MYVGGMHFQDGYNYDIERVKRCSIHYACPDDRIIPSAPTMADRLYRDEVEKKFAIPIEEWKKTKGPSTCKHQNRDVKI